MEESILKLFRRANGLKNKNSILLFFTSLFSMLFCMVCLAGSTWAWFTANQMVSVGTITSAEWKLGEVTVTQTNPEVTDEPVVTETENGKEFEVLENTEYRVTATAEGRASDGFILIKTCDGSFYAAGKSIDLNLILSKADNVTISASWGKEYGDAQPISENSIGMGQVAVISEKDVEETTETAETTEVPVEEEENIETTETTETIETTEVAVTEETETVESTEETESTESMKETSP